jgi:hypothetical protein
MDDAVEYVDAEELAAPVVNFNDEEEQRNEPYVRPHGQQPGPPVPRQGPAPAPILAPTFPSSDFLTATNRLQSESHRKSSFACFVSSFSFFSSFPSSCFPVSKR